ncbi:MAG: DNA-3-methyladenine glycosylase [Candidatus Nomurabacteria bacterium]|nr:DNA-3-methyladenine glycosylase [Candidatus Nomurabacteria bacterium]
MKKLPLSFFNRPALIVAKELIGCYFCLRMNGVVARYKITETEAYIGPHDMASHASKGRTKRTEVMYGEAGTIYVYFIYGMYHMFNIVTGQKDFPAAVLLRGIEGWNGPGKLTKQFGIDKRVNGKLLGTQTGIWIEQPLTSNRIKIKRTARVGVSYAGPIWAEKKYRFILLPD